MPITENHAWEEAAATIDATERMLVTLEFHHSTFLEGSTPTPIRAVCNTEDLTFRLDDNALLNAGQDVLFKGIPFRIGYPRIGKLAVEAPLELDDVNPDVSKYLEPATKLNESIVVFFRGYLLSDPTTVGQGPFRLLLRSVKRKGSTLQGTLTMADPTKLRVMREVYDAQRFPALMVAAGA